MHRVALKLNRKDCRESDLAIPKDMPSCNCSNQSNLMDSDSDLEKANKGIIAIPQHLSGQIIICSALCKASLE